MDTSEIISRILNCIKAIEKDSFPSVPGYISKRDYQFDLAKCFESAQRALTLLDFLQAKVNPELYENRVKENYQGYVIEPDTYRVFFSPRGIRGVENMAREIEIEFAADDIRPATIEEQKNATYIVY